MHPFPSRESITGSTTSSSTKTPLGRDVGATATSSTSGSGARPQTTPAIRSSLLAHVLPWVGAGPCACPVAHIRLTRTPKCRVAQPPARLWRVRPKLLPLLAPSAVAAIPSAPCHRYAKVKGTNVSQRIDTHARKGQPKPPISSGAGDWRRLRAHRLTNHRYSPRRRPVL